MQAYEKIKYHSKEYCEEYYFTSFIGDNFLANFLPGEQLAVA